MEIEDKQQVEQRVEGNSKEIIPNESLDGVIYKTKLLDTPEAYREATEEEKVLDCAVKMVLKVLANNKKPISITEQEQLLERTVKQVRAERQNMFVVLNEAEEELKSLKWTDILPRSITSENRVMVSGRRVVKTNNSSHGFRGLYFISFGNFVLAKDKETWIYRPTQQQYLSVVQRWPKKKQCEAFSTQLRSELRMSHLERAKLQPPYDENYYESESMKKFKEQILVQIKELRETV